MHGNLDLRRRSRYGLNYFLFIFVRSYWNTDELSHQNTFQGCWIKPNHESENAIYIKSLVGPEAGTLACTLALPGNNLEMSTIKHLLTTNIHVDLVSVRRLHLYTAVRRSSQNRSLLEPCPEGNFIIVSGPLLAK